VTAAPERPRRGWRRALALVGIIAGAYGLAVLVARPHVPDPATNPYVGKRGGSLAKSAGLEIRFRRGDEVRVLDPQTALRVGDELVFTVRADGPTYLEVRWRDGAGAVQTIFPHDGATTTGPPMTPLVTPRQELDRVRIAQPGAGKVVVTALFSDHPRPVGAPADPETRAITAVVAKE
jgi:hypothetical protein